MTDEISLSLEETNSIRKQLGLKPIEPVLRTESREPYIEQEKEEPRKTENDNGYQFMDTDKVSSLRKRLASLRNTSNVYSSEQDNEDWLNKIGTKKKHKPVKVIHEDEPEDNLLNIKVSHGINELDSKKGVVLTLKEQSVEDENNGSDILENADLAQAQRDHQNVRLKKLRKQRNLKPLQLSSFDLDRDEEQSIDKNSSVIVVGGENKVDKDQEVMHNDAGKERVKLEFDEDSDNDGDEMPTDFQPVKIKRRSKKDVRSRVKLPSEIQPVSLVDEDEDVEEMQEQVSMAVRPLLKNKTQTPEEIAQQARREKLERQERSLNLSYLNKNSNQVIDENVQFLESLKANIVGSDKQVEQEHEKRKQEKSLFQERKEKVQQEPFTTGRQDIPDFSTGLASTLHFLKEKDLLPSNDVSQEYNPEINLVYRDERGIPLTTKEAYKRLSQKFHGTKSNRRTKEKFESKLQARRSRNSTIDEREFQLEP